MAFSSVAKKLKNMVRGGFHAGQILCKQNGSREGLDVSEQIEIGIFMTVSVCVCLPLIPPLPLMSGDH